MSAVPCVPLLLVALALGACSSDSSDEAVDPIPDSVTDVEDADADAPPLSDPPDPTPGPGDGDVANPLVDPDIPAPEPMDGGDDGDRTDPLVDPDTSTPEPIEGDEDGDGTDPPVDPDTSTPEPIEGDEDGDGTDPPVDPDTSTPGPTGGATSGVVFPGRPDATRLLDAVTIVVENTLLDLNNGLGEGRDFTDQQEDCLGAFDPGAGDQLFAIECSRPLATEPFPIYVERAAFEPTETCRASLSERRADGCTLALAGVEVRVDFTAPSVGLPRPVDGSGVLIRHSVEEGVFEVAKIPENPVGDFLCAIDISTGTVLPQTRGDCDSVLARTADYVDTLIVTR